jgi:hypothetical protein
VDVNLRFGDNSMEKINLPIPDVAGPPTYDNAFIIFTRNGTSASGIAKFTLDVADAAGLAARQRAARASEDFAMQGGRRWGLLFK